jgi:hypothetical protein
MQEHPSFLAFTTRFFISRLNTSIPSRNIGDSHSDFKSAAYRGDFGFFGQRLKELLDGKGYDTSLYAASNSTPKWWFDGINRTTTTWGATEAIGNNQPFTPTNVRKLDYIFPERKPPVDLVVIEQGTNMLGKDEEDNSKQITGFVDRLRSKAKACLWVGAPRYPPQIYPEKQQTALWDLIQKHEKPKNGWFVYNSRFQPNRDETGKPVFITDFKYCARNKKDKEHLCMEAASKWAEGVSLMIGYIHDIQTRGSDTTVKQK